MLKIDGDLEFLKGDRFSSGNVNMAKIYERLLSKNIPQEKRQDSFDPQRVNLLGEDSICMVNLLVIPQKIVVVFYYMFDLLQLFQTRSFVLSSEHENRNVATLGALFFFFFFFFLFFNFYFFFNHKHT